MNCPTLASPLAPLLALLLAVSPLPAQSAGPDAFLSEFRLSGEYLVEIGGKEQPKAELYFSERARAYLIKSSELPSPVLVSPAAREVQSLDLMKVAVRPDGTIDVLADAVLAPEGGYRLEGESIRFSAAGKPVRLKPRPWLLGPHAGAEVGEHNPEYARRARDYTPDAGIIARLRARAEPVRVLTFFGTWCPHCRKHVPMLLKVDEQLAGSGWRFDYYGLPSPFTDEAEASRYGVKGVPTAIVFVGGREVGRLPAASWVKPEAGLDQVLAGGGTPGSL